MSIKVLMPALSPTMTEGSLNKWLVKVGDKVKAGDILVEIETDKATMEVEAVDEGIISEIIVKEGTTGVNVNSPIALIQSEGENLKSKKVKKENIQNKLSENVNTTIKSLETSKVNKKTFNDSIKIEKLGDRVFASPIAKIIAKEKDLDLKNIQGSGPNGRVIKRDFDNAKSQNNNLPTSSSIKDIVKASSIRKIIADRTTHAKNTVPHFYLKIESNVDKLILLRKKINENNQNDKISVNDILVKALAMAQYKNPNTNVSWSNGDIIKYSSVDVSIAVSLEEGLITPIIKNANEKGLLEISKEIKILVKKAREGKLSKDEYTGGTISISNLGMFGIREFGAIINLPQSSILAVGTIQKVPSVVEDKIVPVNKLNSTLSADHRVLDGSVAAKLLKDFNDIIENPFEVWLQSEDMEII